MFEQLLSLHLQSMQGLISLFPLKVCTHQIPAVVLPEGGDGTGAGLPQQTETETAVGMHPDLLLGKTSLLLNTHKRIT